MKFVREPSVVRRVMLALVAAFAFLWVAFLVCATLTISLRGTGEFDTGLRRQVDALSVAFEQLSTASEVRAAAASLTAIQQSERAALQADSDREVFSTYIVVLAADGSTVYRAPGAPTPDYAALPAGLSTIQAGGQAWNVLAGPSGRWRMQVFDRADLRQNEVLRAVGPEVSSYLAVAFIITALAMVLAVRGGLVPLRRLSAAVAARAPGDLAPLGMQVRHSELRPLADALNSMFARLAAAMARERTFVHDAAHELRTPLAVIAAQAHVLAHAADSTARAEALRRLNGALARSSRVAGQLLRLAQLEERSEPSCAAMDLMPLVRDTVADFGARAADCGIELAVAAPDAVTAYIEPAALRSILDNLVDNAMRHGAQHGTVEVRVVPGADAVRIMVVDDGPGIPADEREHVFERFRRGRQAMAAGAGLGLTIVQQAAANMGGSVSLEAGPGGRGCCFEVALPAP